MKRSDLKAQNTADINAVLEIIQNRLYELDQINPSYRVRVSKYIFWCMLSAAVMCKNTI